MMNEIFKNDENEYKIQDPTRGYKFIVLSLATSIDALAFGFSASLLKTSMWFSIIIIGITALFFTVIGLYIGS